MSTTWLPAAAVVILSCCCLHPCTARSSVNYALSFTGQHEIVATDEHINFTDPGFDQITDSITVALWVRFQQSIDSDAPQTFELLSDDNWFGFPLCSSSSCYFTVRKSFYEFKVPPEEYLFSWAHFAITVSQTEFSIYVNGKVKLAEELPVGKPFHQWNTLPVFGGDLMHVGGTLQHVSERTFMGGIDDFQMYSRWLSVAEVEALWEKRWVVEEPCPPDLVLYYDFELHCDVGVDLDDPSCDGFATGRVRNLGSAGRKYDLSLNSVLGVSEFVDLDLHPVQMKRAGLNAARNVELANAWASLRHVNVSTVISELPNARVETLFHVADLQSQSNDTGTVFQVIDMPKFGVVRVIGNDTPSSSVELHAQQDDQIFLTNTAQVVYESPVVLPAIPIQGAPLGRFSLSAQGRVYDHHIWPCFPPRGASVEHTFVEDASYSFLLQDHVEIFHNQGDDLVIHIVKTTTNGMLESHAGGGISVPRTPLIDGSTFSTAYTITYTPNTDTFGFNHDYFEYTLVSEHTSVQSSLYRFMFNINPENDVPSSWDVTVDITEDDPEGIWIELNVTDVDDDVTSIAVESLPSKGDLFVVDEQGHRTLLTDEFRPLDNSFGYVYGQYASQVVNVSTFWNPPPQIYYHPMQITGRPSCRERFLHKSCNDGRFSETIDGIQENPIVGDLVALVSSHLPNEYHGGVFHGHVVNVDATNLTNPRFDVDIIVMYIRDEDGKVKPCLPMSPTYPNDCDTEVDIDRLKHLKSIPRAAITGITSGLGWSPLTQSFAGNQTLSRATSVAFGEEFEFAHDQSTTYPRNLYDARRPPYTEFIEVKFPNKVYPTELDYGSAGGGGAVVHIQAKSSDGVWATLYEGPVDQAQSHRHFERGTYHLEQTNLCVPFFKTDHIRLELDTSMETGVRKWANVDYVELFGTDELPAAALEFGKSKVLYVPHHNAYGQDSFKFRGYDCVRDRSRWGKHGIATININPVFDAPCLVEVGGRHPSQMNAAGEMHVSLRHTSRKSYEVRNHDGSPLHVRILHVPDFVSVLLEGVPMTQGSTMALSSTSTTVSLDITGEFCKVAVDQRGEMNFTVEAVNSTDSPVVQTVPVTLTCGSLPVDVEFNQVDYALSTFLLVLGSVGIVTLPLFVGFNIVWRDHAVVKMTSPVLNMVLIFGCGLLYGLVVYQSMPSALEDCPNMFHNNFTAQDVENGIECDACCEHASQLYCGTTYMMTSVGLTLCILPLLAKAYRVKCLFVKEQVHFQRHTNMSTIGLLKWIAGCGVSLVVFLVAWILAVGFTFKFELTRTGESLDGHVSMLANASCSCPGNTHTVLQVLLSVGVAGMLLLLCHFAWQIRKLTLEQLNESKQIFLVAYTGLVFAILLVSLLLGVPHPHSVFVISNMFIWLFATLLLWAIHLPRMVEVFNGTQVNISAELMDYSLRTSKRYNSNAQHGFSSQEKSVSKLFAIQEGVATV